MAFYTASIFFWVLAGTVSPMLAIPACAMLLCGVADALNGNDDNDD
jgi:hypothetical protein